MKKLDFLVCAIAVVALLLRPSSPEKDKYKAYLYKQPEKDGLLCIFYSKNPGIPEQNAQLFATMCQEKFGMVLTVRTEPY